MRAILGILGATGVGKSNLAINLAQKLNTKIISADSMQIYKQMNIGTAKVTAEQMQQVEHFMIDVVEPYINYSAFDYANAVDDILKKQFEGQQIPIMVGGTGLYFDTLLYGLDFPSNEQTQIVRQEMLELYNTKGQSALLNVLKEKDSITYNLIDKNNIKRVIRAIEIASQGRSMYGEQNQHQPRYQSMLFALTRDREQIYKNIDLRVDSMINYGLVKEVQSLLSQYKDYQYYTAFKAIGYKEIISALNGDITIEQAIEQIKLNTRHYAKRQISYFKRLNVEWINLDNFATLDDVRDYIIDKYNSAF